MEPRHEGLSEGGGRRGKRTKLQEAGTACDKHVTVLGRGCGGEVGRAARSALAITELLRLRVATGTNKRRDCLSNGQSWDKALFPVRLQRFPSHPTVGTEYLLLDYQGTQNKLYYFYIMLTL